MPRPTTFNPTALSMPFINLLSRDVACVVASGGGLIRALCGSFLNNIGMNSAVLKVVISCSLFILIVASFLAWFIAKIPHDPSIPALKGELEIQSAEAALDPTIYSVPFCDMLNNPTRYHRKLVRTQAIFVNDVDWAYIRNDACPNEDGGVRAVGALESNDRLIESKSRDQIGPIIDRLLKQDAFSLEVNADMVGRFYAGSKTGRGNEFAILYEFSVSPTGKRL